MHASRRSLFLALLTASLGSGSLHAQTTQPPPPLSMGVAYTYQLGNPNWYQPIAYSSVYVSPNPWYLYSSPYPFGSASPVFGLYSWDYGVTYPATLNYVPSWYPTYSYAAAGGTVTASPQLGGYPSHYLYYSYTYQNPQQPGRVWLGFGW